MQQPTLYPPLPTSGSRWAVSGLGTLLLILLVVALVGVGLFSLQWASQRGITLGYPVPQVRISAAQTSLVLRQSYQFSANASGRDLTYSWDYGDGSGDYGSNVTHSYQSNGNFTVTVTVRDGIGHTSFDTVSVRVLPPPPVAAFSISYSYYGGYVYFDASVSSADPSTGIATYYWTFGDGYTDTTSYSQESHGYSYTGTYTVTLVVMDSTGQSSAPASQAVIIP